MTKEQKLDFLIRYHANLTEQLKTQLSNGGMELGKQIRVVEKEIQMLLDI